MQLVESIRAKMVNESSNTTTTRRLLTAFQWVDVEGLGYIDYVDFKTVIQQIVLKESKGKTDAPTPYSCTV